MKLKIISPKFGEHIVYIDDEDYPLVSEYKWHINYHGKSVYATHVFRLNGKTYSYKMHRLILGFPKWKIDHKDENGLNNMKSNLRKATHAQNTHNKGKTSRNKSGYKGVALHKRDKTYQAGICVNGKYYYSCGHRTAIEAAEKYNELAIKYHKEFAKLNIIDEKELAKAKSIKRERKIGVKPLGITGIRGVHKSGTKEFPFAAVKRVGSKIIRIGVFKTAEEASEKYNEFVIKNKKCL